MSIPDITNAFISKSSNKKKTFYDYDYELFPARLVSAKTLVWLFQTGMSSIKQAIYVLAT